MPLFELYINGQATSMNATIEGDAPTFTAAMKSDMALPWHSPNYTTGAATKRVGDVYEALPLGPGTHNIRFMGEGGFPKIEAQVTYRQRATVPVEVTLIVDPIGFVRDNQTVENKMIRTAPGGPIGVHVIGANAKLLNVSFTDKGGYLSKISGDGCTVDGFNATTCTDYAIYAEGANRLTIKNMRVVGGSRRADEQGQGESILRFDSCKDVLVEDCYLDYRPVPAPYRKACIRGFIDKGVFNRVKTFGAVVGLTPMTGFDAGEGLIAGGVLRINRKPWIVTVANRPEWEAMVKQIVGEGVKETEAILRELLRRLPVRVKIDGATVALQVSDVDVDMTVSERIRMLGQRSTTTHNDCEYDLIRNSAGGVQTYNGGKITGDIFGVWDEPTYPNAGYRLPKDIERPAPVTIFNGTRFESSVMSIGAFVKRCKDLGIVLNDCTFNGSPAVIAQ